MMPPATSTKRKDVKEWTTGKTIADHGRCGEYQTHELVKGRGRERKIVLEQGAPSLQEYK